MALSKPRWSPVPLLHFLGVWERVSGLAAECGSNGNILSVDSPLRFGFDKFYWWLEEVPGKVCPSAVLVMWTAQAYIHTLAPCVQNTDATRRRLETLPGSLQYLRRWDCDFLS